MARRVCLACLIWLLYETTSAPAQEGRLERVRNDVRGSDAASSRDSTPRRSNDNGCDEEDGFLSQLVSSILEGLLTFDFSSDQDDGESPGRGHGFWRRSTGPRYNHFIPYPYCGNFPGQRVPRAGRWPEALAPWDHKVEPVRWSARLSIEDGNDFTGLNRANARLLLETSSGWGFLTSWNHFYESLNASKHDELVIGDFNVIYSAGLTTDWSVRAGLGARTLVDHGRSDWGVNVHFGTDIFPVRPLIVSISSDFGNVGSAGFAHGRATFGAIHRGWELFGGYDVMAIGGTTLHGPLVGLRLWF